MNSPRRSLGEALGATTRQPERFGIPNISDPSQVTRPQQRTEPGKFGKSSPDLGLSDEPLTERTTAPRPNRWAADVCARAG